MSRTHKVLQGLRLSTHTTNVPSRGVVMGMEATPMYRPFRQPLFFLDGHIAVRGREPQLVCDDYRLRLRQADGSTCWVRVSRDIYQRAAIGQPIPA